MRTHWRKKGRVLGVLYFCTGSCYALFLACGTIRTNFLKCFIKMFIIQFFAHVSAGLNISCSFGALYFWSFTQVTAGSKVLGSFSAFHYKFCEQVTTGANVWRFLSLILRKSCGGRNCYNSFSVCYHWFCGQLTARAVMISRVTASGSGMCGVLAFVLFFSFILHKWPLELAFFLDHFTSFNLNFVFL